MQKTTYCVRIMDWSSDVSASDRAAASSRIVMSPSASPYHQVPDLAHIFHGEAHAFAAETRILDPAIGHVVDAVGGHIIDDDAANVEMIPRPQYLVDVACEQPCL